ncbi:hypothetical protein [Methanobacterium sp.]
MVFSSGFLTAAAKISKIFWPNHGDKRKESVNDLKTILSIE